MKIIYLVYYTLFGLLLFFVKNYLKRKDRTINDIVVSLIFLIVMSGVVSVFDFVGCDGNCDDDRVYVAAEKDFGKK